MKTVRQPVTAGTNFNGTAGLGLIDFVTGAQNLSLPADQLVVPKIINVELRLAGAPAAAPTSIVCVLDPNDGSGPEERFTITDTVVAASTVPVGFMSLGCGIPVPRLSDTGLPWILQLFTTGLTVDASFNVSFTRGRI